MTHSVRRNTVRLRGLLVVGAALVLLSSPAFAGEQDPSENSSAQGVSSAPPPDFLLGRPRAMLGIRGGLFMASAGSDFYDDMINFLTLEKSDFRTGSFSGELAISVSPQLDVVGAFGFNKINRASEDRTHNERLSSGREVPIEQTTELSEQNFAVSAKYSLVSRGRRVSRLAWIPRTIVPYVGAGAGYGKYNLRQNGDFHDEGNPANPADDTVFSDTFRSEGWAPLFQAFGGTDIQLYRRLILSLEGRYTWKKADLSADYVGYQPIDLGGLRFGAGVHFSF